MNEINSVFVGLGVSESAKETTGFSKKNAWKNEWEKAQLESRGNNDHVSDNKKHVLDKNEQLETLNDKYVHQPVAAASPEHANENAMISVAGESSQSQGNTHFPLIGPISLADVSYHSPGFVTKQNIASGSKGVSAGSSNASISSYTQGVVENIEAKLITKFKLQNLNLMKSDSGVKIIMRDYRQDKIQLTKVIENIKEYLNEFGIDVDQVIVNGVRNEY